MLKELLMITMLSSTGSSQPEVEPAYVKYLQHSVEVGKEDVNLPRKEIKVEERKVIKKKAPIKKVEPAKPKGEHIRMEVTGYTAGYESTQKKKGEVGYGITASGNYVEQGVTIAAGKQIPFGTKVYIPFFDNQPGFNDGMFIVEDRGGAIGPYNIDVYHESLSEAQQFGRNVLDVYIMEE